MAIATAVQAILLRARSASAAVRILSFATFMDTHSRLAPSDLSRSTGYGHCWRGSSWKLRKKLAISSTAMLLATSPALWPPMPSATTNKRSFV